MSQGVSPFVVLCTTLAAIGVTATLMMTTDKSGAKKKKRARKGRRAASSAGGRTFIVGGNWKCATDSAKVESITAMLNSMSPIPPGVEVFVAPPSPHVASVLSELRSDIAVSSQDCGKCCDGARLESEYDPLTHPEPS